MVIAKQILTCNTHTRDRKEQILDIVLPSRKNGTSNNERVCKWSRLPKYPKSLTPQEHDKSNTQRFDIL